MMFDEDSAEASKSKELPQTKDERSASRFLGPVVKMRGTIETSGKYSAAYFLHVGCFGIRGTEIAAVGGTVPLWKFERLICKIA
jgi:hypothetical protein